MTAGPSAFRSPYTPSPGSSTPGPETTPAEGTAELWAFFWVAIVSVVIITIGGLGAYFYVHP